jgi:hypothetical protein
MSKTVTVILIYHCHKLIELRAVERGQTGSRLWTGTVVHIRNEIKILYKSKVIPVTGHGGLKGCQMLRIPYFLDKRLRDGGKGVSLTLGLHLTPRKIFWYSFFL